jgi:hypothetical protein
MIPSLFVSQVAAAYVVSRPLPRGRRSQLTTTTRQGKFAGYFALTVTGILLVATAMVIYYALWQTT